ncbi:MAG: hypothetical protein RIE73_10465 [Coleofasciculus sp. C1-SOL-03]|jgi:hypothetical protein|uniref:hypothetical protein n=1 Tax=Coleofasciculus sp. C1-SOL-03 TaxID=3069522 RepID=UPI003304B58E
MKKRPSNIVLQVVIGIALLFAAYVIGGFLIKTRREVKDTPEASLIHIKSNKSNCIGYNR